MLKKIIPLALLPLLIPAPNPSDCRSSEPEIKAAFTQVSSAYAALLPLADRPILRNVSQCALIYDSDDFCYSHIMIEVAELNVAIHGIHLVLPKHIIDFNTGHCEWDG